MSGMGRHSQLFSRTLRAHNTLITRLLGRTEQSEAPLNKSLKISQRLADEALLAVLRDSRDSSCPQTTWGRVVSVYRHHLPRAPDHSIRLRAINTALEHGPGSREIRRVSELLRAQLLSPGPHTPPARLLIQYMLLRARAADAHTEMDVAALCAQLDTDRLLPQMSASNRGALVTALSLTSLWRRGLEHVDTLLSGEESADEGADGGTGFEAISQLAAAAFTAGDFSQARHLADRLARHQERLSEAALLAWLQALGRVSRANVASAAHYEGRDTDSARLSQLLEYLQQSHCELPEAVCEALRLHALSIGWHVQSSYVLDSSASCGACGTRLQAPWLEAAQIRRLHDTLFQQHEFVGDGVFISSTPSEADSFRRYVARTAPYDVVIDGLNVSRVLIRAEGTASRLLCGVVEHFACTCQQRVLVVGRSHMNGWRHLEAVRRHALVFTAANMSHDDAFLLRAVLCSRPQTLFVTNDYLRNYVTKLASRRARATLHHLLRYNRVGVRGVDSRGDIQLSMPPPYSVKVQSSGATTDSVRWHVPYSRNTPRSETMCTPPPTYQCPSTWLCLTPR